MMALCVSVITLLTIAVFELLLGISMLRIKFAVVFFAIFLFAACDSAGTGAANSDAAASADKTPAAAASSSAAAEPDPRMAAAVKSRKAMLTVLKDNFVPLALMAGGRIEYDAAIAQRNAARLPVMIGMFEERFAIDTRGSGVETEALDKVWEDNDAFKGKIRDALEAANKLAAVAGDPAQYKDATMAMRSACGACHDDFRVEED